MGKNPIYGYAGSTAETHANRLGVKFIPIFETGDLNGDGVVNSADIIILKQAIYGSQKLSPNQAIAGNINSDGKIDVYDLALLKRNIIQYNYIIKNQYMTCLGEEI